MLSKICVIIPAYNASKTVGNVVSGVLKYIPRVIVADDGSTDATGEVASSAGAELLTIGENKGKGNALKLLFRKAMEEGYSAVISMDADGQHDPEDIPKFLVAYNLHKDNIIVGSRMHEKEKIPRARYNSMHIARFYISLAANQFIEDTQCGFRLYPLSLIKKLRLTTEKYVTETEILMKAGDMGRTVRFVDIKTIYGDNGSHFRPIADVADITAYVISYIQVKWIIEGVTSNNPNTYSARGHLRDTISGNKTLDILFRALTAFATLPVSIFFLIEYTLLRLLVPHNFASIRKLGCGFARITFATQMLPVVLVIAIIQKFGNKAGFKLDLVDGFVNRFFPHLWNNESGSNSLKV
jgi:glycosyltransferase involved in cell wall biosynthesis